MRSLPLGRAFGIPLSVHWSFILLPLYLLTDGYFRGVRPAAICFGQVFLLSMFGCVLLHELGHALMARAFRIRTRDITLYPIGGVARLESTGHSPFQEVCIALAGPAVNLALGFLFGALALGAALLGGMPKSLDQFTGEGPLASIALGFLAAVCLGNGMLLAFNLIPAFPMDGGRVLRALLTLPLGLIPATEVAAGIGLLLALGMAALGLLVWHTPSLVLVSVFVIFAGQAELASLRRWEAGRRQPRRAWQPPQPAGEPLVRVDDPLDPTVPMRPVGTTVVVGPAGGFTGFLWDPEQRVWVRWIDGQRIDVF